MKRGRTLCSIEAVNGFQVCLWNESECCLVHLVPSKYLSKNNSTQGNHYWPPPFLPPSPPPDVWAKTNTFRANTGKGIQRTCIYWAACRALGSFHSSTTWATVSCTLAADMARLALPVFLILSFSLLHICNSGPSRTRKAVSPRQSGGNCINPIKSWLYLTCVCVFFLNCLLLVQLQRRRMWCHSSRGCGRRSILWKKCWHCRQVLVRAFLHSW